ncbi:MAG: trypsin-like peptidase domain-containing protein [Acidobacteriota bacterium]|nr:trypsin-like peptidase domain-containing protein [Acidobacteriota bacterium]
MPEETSGLSRVCPSCGRRVPGTVATCRCGAAIAVEADPEVVPETETGSTDYTMAGVVAVAVIIVALVAFSYLRPSEPDTTQRDAAVAEPGTDAAAPAAPDSSPERRAWDASAADPGVKPAPPSATPAEPAPAADVPADLEDVVGRVMPAVVRVETSAGTGSGFYVRPDTVLTNVHVVRDDTYVTLRQMDGSTVQARVDSRTPAFDIAVLKVATPSVRQVMIPIGSAKTLRPGQEVMAIGSALGTLHNSVTRGIVSGVRQSRGATLVQTDTAANPGNSGGPLMDRTGTAIGIITMGYTGRQGLNFAVAIDHARDILDGRQVSTPSGSLTLDDVRSPSAGQPSEAQRIQEDGARAFLSGIEQLSQAAGDLDAGWKRFRDQCYSSAINGSFDREWFAVLSPRAMTAPVPSQCSSYFANFKAEAGRFSGVMRRQLEDARRAGVLPGVIRDTLRSHRLQFEGWDR